jgi:hypothetical protein
VLLALLALALLLFILWQTVFKSVLESTAKDAVKEQTAQATQAADDAKAAQKAAENAAAAAGANPNGGGGGATTTTVPGSVGQGGVLGQGTPSAFRLVPNNALPVPNNTTFVASDPAPIPNGQQFLLTDIVFQNSAGDTGTIRVLRGTDILFEIGLNNFRDLDYHFVTPIVVPQGQGLTVAVACQVTVNNGPCTSSAYFAGVNSAPPA